MSYTIRPLDTSTWAAFAELVERNNGIFGGCWCIGYHPECGLKRISHRAVKEDVSGQVALTPRWSSTTTAPHRGSAALPKSGSV